MPKKVFVTLAAVALVLGTISHTSTPKNLADACSPVCRKHDGDVWSN